MSFNYKFCAKVIKKYIKNKNVKVLDYGCGSGEIINYLDDLGIDAYGCDIYSGGEIESAKAFEASLRKVNKNYFKNGRIKNMETNSQIPFPTDTFDIVLSNQVLEHVEDLDSTLIEFKRVLSPDGLVLSLFPDKGVWFEGHCRIWFINWFPPKSKFRIYLVFLYEIFR